MNLPMNAKQLKKVADAVANQDFSLSRYQAAEIAEALIKKYGKEAYAVALKPYVIDGKKVW